MEEGIFLYQARTAQGIALNILRPPPHFLLFSGKKSVGGGNFCFPLPVGRPAEKKWDGEEEEEEEEANKQTSRLWPGAEERRTENRGRRRREKERGKRASTSRQPPLRRLILLRIAAHFFV